MFSNFNFLFFSVSLIGAYKIKHNNRICVKNLFPKKLISNKSSTSLFLLNSYVFFYLNDFDTLNKISFLGNFNLTKVFKKNTYKNQIYFNFISLSPVTNYLGYFSLSSNCYKLVVNSLNNIVLNKSFSSLVYFLKLLFWYLDVPKHRIVFLFTRKLFDFIFYNFCIFYKIHRLGFKFQGKLSVTGNKRTRVFKKDYFLKNINYKKLSKFQLNLKVFEYKTIRTTTGLFSLYFYMFI